MINSEFKLKLAIISTIIALICLLGTFKLYNIYEVEKPLADLIMAVPGVEKVVIEKQHGNYQLNVDLAQVDNLQEKYQDLDQTIAKKLDPGSYTVVIKDQRNPNLDKFYDYAQLAIYQAVDDKEYLHLDQTLQQNALKAGIRCSLFIDGECIYIQAFDGSSYMYEIVPHSSINESGKKNGGKVS